MDIAVPFQIPKTGVHAWKYHIVNVTRLDHILWTGSWVIREILDCCYSFSAPCIAIMQFYDF